jgi:hypothetical protein
VQHTWVVGGFRPDNGLAKGRFAHLATSFMHVSRRNQQVLAMRKRIKLTGFKDWDSMFYNNLLCIPILVVASVLLEDWGSTNLNLNL